jgi:nitric oxide reductase NorQ protein
MDYMPRDEEVKLLAARHPELAKGLIEEIVAIADAIRKAPELSASLSVRATEEACIYLKHPLMETEQRRLFPEVLKSSFCGRFSGKWNDVSSDAGAVWALVEGALRKQKEGS